MSHRTPNDSSPKAAISVAEMARLVGLSYNHFRALCRRGVFPMPTYSLVNKRPFFDIDAQEACLQVKETNIGHDGRYVIFYGPRKKTEAPAVSQIGKNRPSGRAAELAKALKHLGQDVSAQQVENVIGEVFPEGVPAEDGQAIRSLFLHFKKTGTR